MRSITIVKDEKGTIKVGQFGNYRQCSWIGEVKSDSEIIDELKDYFFKFVKNKSNIKKLEESIKNLSFYTGKDDSFIKMFYSNKKSDTDYYNTWIDSEPGVCILDTIITQKTDDVQLQDYSSKVNDSMFAELVFEIDLQKHFASVKFRSSELERYDFDSQTMLTTEKKIVKEIKQSPPALTVKGRKDLW